MRPALLAAALVVVGCAPSERVGVRDPISRPIVALRSPDEVFGFQADISTYSTLYLGELVACDETFAYLYLNGVVGEPWQKVPWANTVRAFVRTHSSTNATAIAWSVIGTVSSASHGWLAIYTAPSWAAVGTASVVGSIFSERVNGECPELRAYSRFPQGLPASMRHHYFEPTPLQIPAPSAPPAPPAPPPPGLPPASPSVLDEAAPRAR